MTVPFRHANETVALLDGREMSLSENDGWSAASHPADEQNPAPDSGPVDGPGGAGNGDRHRSMQVGKQTVQRREGDSTTPFGTPHECCRHGDCERVGRNHSQGRSVQMPVLKTEHDVTRQLTGNQRKGDR